MKKFVRRRGARRVKRRRAGKKLVTKSALNRTLNKRIETKQFIYYNGGVAVSTGAGTVFCLNAPNGVALGSGVTPNIVMSTTFGAQGYGGHQRIGNKISIRELEFRTSVVLSGATSGGLLRMLVVHYKNNEGQGMTAGDILWSTAAGLAAVAPVRYMSKSQYTIWSDRLYSINLMGGASDQQRTYSVKWRKRFKKLHETEYYDDTAATTSAGVQKGAVFLIFVGSNGPMSLRDSYTSVIYQDA